ncbi:MAG: hypothetical protein GX595_05940, partial [Lentisphaerae bacterium]|nr:hypothetical protein [Lentisphaerota bacterium]
MSTPSNEAADAAAVMAVQSLDLDAAGRLAVRYADGLSLQVTPAVQVEGGDQAGPLALAPP